MIETCEKCDYFHQRKAQILNKVQDGQCRRRRPRVYHEKKGKVTIKHSYWPDVLKTDWCGEWIGEQISDEQH